MAVSADRITSASNPLIKRLRGLDRKKHRAETGLFLAEGARLIEQAMTRGWDVDTLVVSSSGLERPASAALMQRAAETGARLVEVPDRLAGSLARKDNPQSILAAIRQKPLDLSELPDQSNSDWIALYEVRDPGNLGTILRTVDCAGASGVIMVEQCCDPYSVEAVRASMGSLFDVALARASFAAFNAWREERGLRMMAASMHGTVAHTEIDFSTPGVILMGNEQSGLPETVEANCDHLCRIPMRGGADSLNLAQATAILTYESWRQRGFA
ncbi:MAG: RNA methyltransferase [Pseudomonadota bacterium]